jgi:hypothetical protein
VQIPDVLHYYYLCDYSHDVAQQDMGFDDLNPLSIIVIKSRPSYFARATG